MESVSTRARASSPWAVWRGARRLPAEDLAWLSVVPATLALLAALAWLGPPLSDLLGAGDYPFYPEWLSVNIRPEPLEQARFALVAIAPVLLSGVVIALGARRPPQPALDPPVIAIQLALCAFVALSVLKQRDNVSIFFLGAFEPLLLPKWNLAAGAAIGVGLGALALWWEPNEGSRARALAAVLDANRWAPLAAAVAVTALWLLPGVITDAGLSASGQIPPGHVPIQFDEFVAVSNGRTPLVDFAPWYSSLVPLALSPVFPLFDWSITSFTVTMSLLSLVALTCAYAALVNVTRRASAALALYLPLMAFTLQPWRTTGSVREFNGNYFAVMPERYLGPLIVLWLLSRRLRRGSPPIWLLFGVAGLAAINNVEFGGAALAALVVGLPLGANREVPAGRWLREHVPEAAAGLLGAAAVVTAVVLIRTGELPDLGLFAYAARLARHGYTLFPAPTWGLHWALYVTYAAALVVAAVRFATRAPDRTLTGMLAFAGVLGLATGGYFAGRSLPWQLWGLFGVWGLALALLGWTAWLSLRSARGGGIASARRLLVAALAALAGLGVMVATLDRFPAPWTQIERIAASGPLPAFADLADEQRFIEERTETGEPVLILGWELEHRLAERAGVLNMSPWFDPRSLVSPNETELAIDQLEEAGGDKVFLNIVQSYVPDNGINARVAEALRARGYVPVARDPASGAVEWRSPASTGA